MAAPIPRPMTHGSAKVPWEAKKPAASKTVSPGTGTPALSRKTPRNTIAYPYRARRFASSAGIVGVRELTRRQIEAGRRLQIRALGEQPRPRRARHALGFGDDRGLVQGQHAPVAHEPAPVHHHGFDVAGLALVHEARDGAQRGREVRAAEVDDDEVGAIARRQPAAVGNTERAIAVARGPRQRLLRRRLTAVGASRAPLSLRTRPRDTGEQTPGAHAATPALTRPSPRPCHRAWNSRMRARPASASAASRSNGPGWPIDARPRSHARSQSTSRRPVSASACA